MNQGQDIALRTLLGAVQGLTEFLPVSSSGHLALFGRWLGMDEGPLPFVVLVHVATLLATLAVLVPEGVRSLRSEQTSLQALKAPLVGLTLGTLATVAVAFPIKGLAEGASERPRAVGIGLLVSGVIVYSVRFLWNRPPALKVPSWLAFMLVGIAQGLAVFPGVSRSGATIGMALWLGFAPMAAFRLSFWLSVPAIVGASLLLLRDLDSGASDGLWVANACGFAAAALVGFGCLKLLRRSLHWGWFHRLAWYLFPLGLLAVVLGP